jgi:hypothetical protein
MKDAELVFGIRPQFRQQFGIERRTVGHHHPRLEAMLFQVGKK